MAAINRYLVFNVGCIECGVSSNIVGTYETEQQAKEIASLMDEELSWREGGQNSFEVFDLLAQQSEEYSEVITSKGILT